jgi:hypothetical protein
MEVIGWEVKPAGLILLVILIVLLATYIVGGLQPPSNENQ